MKSKFTLITIFLVIIFTQCSVKEPKSDFQSNNIPQTYPDYTNIVIPINIAPLNFKILENGEAYFLNIHSKSKDLNLTSKDGTFRFNMNEWKKLLSENINDTLNYHLMVKKDGKWTSFKSFVQFVSADSIDNYLAYRLINTGYVLWEKMGLYERNLESFDEDPIIENTSIRGACVNCHSFANQNPQNMMLHTRMYFSGTTILHNGELKKVETKTAHTLSSGVYPSWHPNGKLIAMSVNKIGQQFHSLSDRRITVSDRASDIIVYNVETNMVSTCPQLTTLNRENLPVWSPDGKTLYFICAPQRKSEPKNAREFAQYSLMRISFTPETNEWGKVDTLISANDIHGSVSFPKPSPDGRYIVFTKAESGYFTIHDNNADLYLFNLETRKISKMNVNSHSSESFHSFNHTGKWVVFSSKRDDNLFTRPYFAHFNADGTTDKAFVLPQKNPEFYADYLLNYNIPEFITAKVEASPIKLRDAIIKDAVTVNFDPEVDLDAITGATKETKKVYKD